MQKQKIYNPPPTLKRFHLSHAFVRGIMGPVGSGKSTGCCAELMSRACEQEPDSRGVRRSRFAVARNTYRELADTTVRTWLDWFDEDTFGKFNGTSMEHPLRFRLDDNTTVDCEVLFRALDRPDDVKKLLSLELTGAWFNEAREFPLSVVEAMTDRVGRYPAIKDGGCTWRGIIMDTNPPDNDHWWYRLAEEERPSTWEFFRQPGGLLEQGGRFGANPDAENLTGLEPEYYITRMAGKSADHVRVYYCAQYGFVRDGKPVYPEFSDSFHVAQDIIPALQGTIYVGIDFGLTPAAVFAQRRANGSWAWIDELVSEDMGQVRFAEGLKYKMHHEYPGHEWEIWGDPAGMQRAQTDERTPFDILRAAGLPARPAPTNDFTLRRESVAAVLNRVVDGEPGLIISPKCKELRKGMAGAYCYKRVQVSGQERFHDVPDKGRFSHVCEAGQYLMIGAGEGRQLVRTPSDNRPRPTRAVNNFTLRGAA